jgi:Coenzyme PQQ synthesis protein D (PqqD)
MSVLDKSFVKDDDLMTRNIAGETLIVPVRNRIGDLSSIYTLNEVGARVWQLLDGQTPVAKIVQTITSEYEVSAEEAAADITELLEDWQEVGLVRAVA